MIKETFENYFNDYCNRNNIKNLKYKKTSGYRLGNRKSNPHAIRGNAMDFSLRYLNDYAPITMYDDLFKDMIDHWIYRAGIDNTLGNIHIHIDLGENAPDGQYMPYFFKEDNGKFQYQIEFKDQV